MIGTNAVWIIALSLLGPLLENATAFDLVHCGSALGMESGEIPDKDITASSFHDSSSVGPQHGRLRHDKNGGAWCPKPMVSNESTEYLEITLKGLTAVTGTRTQGRYGNGQGKEYAEEFLLDYWRPGFQAWRRWRDPKAKQLLPGNTNTYLVAEQKVDPLMVASKVRFIPYSSHTRTVCMRVEVIGCPWQEGLLSYSMIQGESGELDLRDRAYDGLEDGGRLVRGLGQLVDGHRGQDNFLIDVFGHGKGYEWVGWRNDSSQLAGRPVEIVFEFQQVRNFSAMYLHTNNMFSKQVQVFSEAKVYLSMNGRSFSGVPISYPYMPDLVMEQARDVTIKLHNKISRFLKLQLFFASKYILISEVSFDSVVAPGNFTDEDVENSVLGSVDHNKEDKLQRDAVHTVIVKQETKKPIGNVPVPVSNVSAEHETNYLAGLLIGVLVTIIVVLVSGIIFMAVTRRRKASAHALEAAFPSEKNELPLRVHVNTNNGHLYGQVAMDEPEKSLFINDQYPNNINMYAFQNNQHISRENSKYAEIPDIVSQEYAVPYLTTAPTPTFNKQSLPATPVRTLPPLHNFGPKPPPVPPPPEKYYAATQICQNRGPVPPTPPPPPGPPPGPPSGGSHYGSSSSSTYSHILLKQDNPEPQQMSINDLRIVDKLGSGSFGEVHLCEVIRTPDSDLCKYVAVKTLRKGASEKLRDEFSKEVNLRLGWKNDNITQLLRVCTSEDPWFLVYEYTELGDLNQFLQDHIAETAASIPANANTLSYGCLIDMASQVASGMQYLEAHKIVHGDLAARSCLVAHGYRIKVSHFKIVPTMYSLDYPILDGRPLPIRWMAWESILHGRLTSKSDVWSFAVTLWEILTFAREQPFEELSDEKVVENARNFEVGEGEVMFLSKPINCSKEIYEIMCECWQRKEKERPRFTEICLFLQRMNLEYNMLNKKK